VCLGSTVGSRGVSDGSDGRVFAMRQIEETMIKAEECTDANRGDYSRVR
jgi:hypothetical protein